MDWRRASIRVVIAHEAFIRIMNAERRTERPRVFAAVADARSFTRGGAKLGKSQSAFSQSVRRLEERLKMRLLTRTTRTCSHAAGEQLLRRFAPLWARLRLSSCAQRSARIAVGIAPAHRRPACR